MTGGKRTVVIGGGPAGLIAARELASRGVEVTVVEEHSTIGRPEKCAGLYSIEGIKKIGVNPSGPYLQNFIRGAVFKSPSGKTFTVEAKGRVAVVTNRERFDQYLAQQAIKTGAEITLGKRVLKIHREDNTYQVYLSGNKVVEADYVVDAEGREAAVARALHPRYHLNGWIPIIQYQVNNHGLDPGMVYLYFKHYLPDFFAYLVPIDDELGKVGVAASSRIYERARKFMREEFPKSRILGIMSSSVYTGKPLEDARLGRVYFVGDAAGHVKATTGGGVIFGGILAAEAAKEIATGEPHFEKALKKTYPELRRIWLLRRLTSRLKPSQLDRLFQAAEDSGLPSFLSDRGNMDYQALTLARLAFSHVTIKFLAGMLKDIFQT
ncbi:MAG TPA: NAD(P)/FAD-dependent oxidoreductase [Aigarchaeota archaeon]|nr:NAD(P)/FAD-dependent oxidoreductase [Aigarchaeota archaeon]